MDAKDPMVKALFELCKREGGHESVADHAKLSAQNLWQIINGTKLPSGRPRGVGPKLRDKLSAAYPDWLAAKLAANAPLPAPAPSGLSPEALMLAQWLDQVSPGIEKLKAFQAAMNEIVQALAPPAPTTEPHQSDALKKSVAKSRMQPLTDNTRGLDPAGPA